MKKKLIFRVLALVGAALSGLTAGAELAQPSMSILHNPEVLKLIPEEYHRLVSFGLMVASSLGFGLTASSVYRGRKKATVVSLVAAPVSPAVAVSVPVDTRTIEQKRAEIEQKRAENVQKRAALKLELKGNQAEQEAIKPSLAQSAALLASASELAKVKATAKAKADAESAKADAALEKAREAHSGPLGDLDSLIARQLQIDLTLEELSGELKNLAKQEKELKNVKA